MLTEQSPTAVVRISTPDVSSSGVVPVRTGKTKVGQLLYDLAFTDLSEQYLAKKHKLKIDAIRRMRQQPDILKLRRKVREDRRRGKTA